jgi:16S rRNA (cytosine1402-N4)-methyltransferase
LERLSQRGRLYGFDQDAAARANIPDGDARFCFVQGNFRFMRGLLRDRGVEGLDGVLADLGVSSHHFDTVERGFSFRGDAPLDMRMNRGGKLTASQVVNTYEPAALIAIFRDYGELDQAHKIAGRIAEARKGAPILSTGELIEAVRPLVPRADENRWLSKLFQALRIEVNGEIEALKMALEQSLKILKPGGRLVVISYHSLEDRLVKNFMRSGNFEGRVEKDFYGRAAVPFELVTRKAIAPTDAEIAANPRSRSAKLRCAEKLKIKN